jgi:UPF0176 protein
MADISSSSNDKEDQSKFTVLALYKFVTPKLTESKVVQQKEDIEAFLRQHNVRGCILLSTEGINGTVCYPDINTGTNHLICEYFKENVPGIRIRLSYANENVFFRLRVRIKKEIVTMGVDDIDPTVAVGEYLKPKEWDEMISDPNCLVIDTRNDYEVELGTFTNAVNPQTTSFTEFPDWFKEQLDTKQPKFTSVAMFCTGGIRCEKATSYCVKLLKDTNVKIPVCHLEGGILRYLEEVPEQESSFQGECYVFDQRTAVTHGLEPSRTYQACHACRHVLTPSDRAHADYRQGVACPYCVADPDREARRARYETRHMHMQVAEQRGIQHIGLQHVPISRSGIPQS